MTVDLNTAVGICAGAVTAIGGVYTTIRHVIASSKRKKAEHSQAILNEAKTEMAKIEASLNEKIKNLEVELQNQKDNISKDLAHLKEIYGAEIKVLGDKIESLRSDLQDQHSSMVALLTKLVNSK
jgi:septal ring factor EnvC (AmiA/AmiB activator)